MPFPAKTTFTLDWTTLADVLTPGLYTAAQLKGMFNQRDQELLDFVNSILATLTAVAPGSSGSENIGSAAISGVAGSAVYAQLVDLKAQLNSMIIGQLPSDLIGALTQRIGFINGGFDAWQRGTSFTPAVGAYMADRWYCTDINGASTFTKQTASPPVGSSSYVRTTFAVLGGYLNFAQALESDICNKLKGKAISVSIQMRRDATFDGQYQIIIEKNAVADTSGGTWVQVGSVTFTPSTSWAMYKLENVVIPNDANGLRIKIASLSGTRPANSYVEVAQFQDNTGTTVIAFQPKSLPDVLIACKRYYERVGVGARGTIMTATNFLLDVRFQVEKRIPPTPTLLTTTPAVTINGAYISGSGSVLSAGYLLNTKNGSGVTINGFTGQTVGASVSINQDDLVAFDAEL